jgi:monoamine oxidase
VEQNPNVDINNTSKYPSADDISVSEWARKNEFGKMGELSAASLCRANVGREAEETSIHYWADYVKSGGGIRSLVSDDESGAQHLFIKEGTSAIAQGLAAELPPGSILLNSPVDEINQHGEHVTVTTANGTRFQARKVVLAIPTNTYTRINFSPPLPAAKRALLTKTKPGQYAKVCITYAKPWWRDLGLLGKFRSHRGPICFSWELSVFDFSAHTLALFIAGEPARKWYELDPLARQQATLDHLREFLDPDQQHLVDDVLEFNVGAWSEEEWFGGAPTSAIPPGLLSRYGEELRKPWKALHFAGGETAREWKGYLEGALRAGSRAADEVVAEVGVKGRL